MHKYDRIGQQGKQIHNDKEQIQFHCLFSSVNLKTINIFTSSGTLLSFSVFFIRSVRRIRTISIKKGIFVFHKWLHRRASARAYIPLISVLENDLDFFDLRLLTPLCPIIFPCFEIIELQV